MDTLRAQLPTLLGQVQGAAKLFLDQFEVRYSDSPIEASGQALGYYREPVVDPKAMNLHHDRTTAALASFAVGWLRDIGRVFLRQAYGHAAVDTDVPEGAKVYVGEACCSRRPLFAVDGQWLVVAVNGPLGVLTIEQNSYSTQGREVHGMWMVSGSVRYRIDLIWENVTVHHVMEEYGGTAEVV